jgi:hypothetical protein
MKTRVIVKKADGFQRFASVELEITVANDFRSTSALTKSTEEHVLTPSGQHHQQSFKSWEAACISGIIYARRKIGHENFHACLTQIEGRLNADEATGFAVASMVAAAKSMIQQIDFTEKELEGWIIGDIQKEA